MLFYFTLASYRKHLQLTCFVVREENGEQYDVISGIVQSHGGACHPRRDPPNRVLDCRFDPERNPRAVVMML